MCRYFKSTSNLYRIIDGDTIAVTSGTLSGLLFEFDGDGCHIKVKNRCAGLYLPNHTPADALMRLLISHNVIRTSDLDA